jgi:hypothetical protein
MSQEVVPSLLKLWFVVFTVTLNCFASIANSDQSGFYEIHFFWLINHITFLLQCKLNPLLLELWCMSCVFLLKHL